MKLTKLTFFLYYGNIFLIIIGNLLLFSFTYLDISAYEQYTMISGSLFFIILIPTLLSIYISLGQFIIAILLLFSKKWSISLHNIFSAIVSMILYFILAQYTIIGVIMQQ